MSTSVAEHVPDATAQAPDTFRRRLLDGLGASIEERGYRESTVADIVRHARTSKRTFYDQFSGKEQCFAELLTANTEDLVRGVAQRLQADPRIDGFVVEAENFESIHNHSAFARIARGL